ncbi:MAG: hypothetical protein HY775_01180 [Acidobacteria bacterium]|nr:hypothetical protein [Acidobacteriota bacterium]
MPTLDFAFLADAADAEPGRKFYVLGGGVDQVHARGFPVVHPHLALLMRFLVHPTETGRPHSLEVRLMDCDGGELAKIEGLLEPQGTPMSGRELGVNLVINMQSMRFERAGDYSVEILMNNQHMKSLPLRVAAPA